MTSPKVDFMEILKRCGGLVKGHFVLASGKHADTYVDKDSIFPHVPDVRRLCWAMAEQFIDNVPDVVVGPALGGIVLSQWTTYELGEKTGHDVRAVFAEKTSDGEFRFRSGYGNLVRDHTVLIVEDILTTGGSVKKIVDLVRRTGGKVIGLGVWCNRGNVAPNDIDVPAIVSLSTLELEDPQPRVWIPSECELCRSQAPINTDLGHGRTFIQSSSNS